MYEHACGHIAEKKKLEFDAVWPGETKKKKILFIVVEETAGLGPGKGREEGSRQHHESHGPGNFTTMIHTMIHGSGCDL